MKILVKILTGMFAAGFLAFLAGVIFIYTVLVPELPSIENLEDAELQVPLRIYDKNEFLLAEYGEHRRIPIEYEDIPKKVEQAFLAAEDDQFWTHSGVDPWALLAAAYELVTTGQKTRGGSTITMQVARNFFLTTEKTYSRKLNEILLALKIERDLDKKTIFELYLNKIYLGKRAYGVVAAAQVYYGKTLEELTLAQAAMIAGLPKAPSRYNPITNPRRALIRRDHIIRRMMQLDFITDDEYTTARAEPITAELHKASVSADARYVTEMVRADMYERYGDEIYGSGMSVYTTIDDRLQTTANRALRSALLAYDRRHGYRGTDGSIDPAFIEQDPFEDELVEEREIGGLLRAVVKQVEDEYVSVYLPDFRVVDIPFEQGIDWAREYINENKIGAELKSPRDLLKPGDQVWVEAVADGWWLAQIPEVQGAIVSIDPSDGAVQALVGGFDYFHHKFNRAFQAKRQPGSVFKPFVYSAALERDFTAASIVNDAPVVFDDDSLEATWRPENYSGRFYGPTRMREALVKSRNLVSIRILQSIGLRHATRYVQRFGFERADMPYDLSLALGSGAFSPLEVVRAYAVFANGGFLVTPYYIDRVESAEGEILSQHQPLSVCQGCEIEAEAKDEVKDSEQIKQAQQTEDASAEQIDEVQYAPRVISPQNAFIMRSILREVVQRGTAVRAKVLGRNDIAGKTGTTNDQKDAWFSGFNDQVVTTSWVGFDNQRPLGSRETGGRAALPMWIDFMREALSGRPVNLEEQPENILSLRIDADSGERANDNTRSSRFEFFVVGTEPPAYQAQALEQNLGGQPGLPPGLAEENIENEIF